MNTWWVCYMFLTTQKHKTIYYIITVKYQKLVTIKKKCLKDQQICIINHFILLVTIQQLPPTTHTSKITSPFNLKT